MSKDIDGRHVIAMSGFGPQATDSIGGQSAAMHGRVTLGIIAGGVVGFTCGAVVYILVNPVLEDASGWVRESQGLLWNLVPFLTVLGALVGGLLLKRIEKQTPRH